MRSDAKRAFEQLVVTVGGSRTVRFADVVDSDEDVAAVREKVYAELGSAFAHTPAEVDSDILHGPVSDRLLAYATEFQATS